MTEPQVRFADTFRIRKHQDPQLASAFNGNAEALRDLQIVCAELLHRVDELEARIKETG